MIRRQFVVAAAVFYGLATLCAQTPPPAGRGAAPTGTVAGGLTLGPSDRPRVDAAAADRGRSVWAAQCITCHGTQARGTDNGPNLVRSDVMLHDRNGSLLGPFLKKGHSMQSGKPSAGLTEAETFDLANFIRQRINDTLRGSPIFHEQDVLTGDAKAGEAYFKGDGGCATCHTNAGRSLAGVASRIPSPIDLQQRMLFPTGRGGPGGGRGNPNTVTVTVTSGGQAPLSGVLVQLDDFYVTLRDTSGVTLHVVKIAPDTKVEKHDPLQAHHELLDRLSDKNIHDLVAYLETMR